MCRNGGWMPKWQKNKEDVTGYGCVHVGMAAASYFFPEIACKCCKVQQTCKEERVRTDLCLLSVEIAVRTTG